MKSLIFKFIIVFVLLGAASAFFPVFRAYALGIIIFITGFYLGWYAKQTKYCV